MTKISEFLVFLSLALCSLTVAYAQNDQSTGSHTQELKTLVVAAESNSDSVIAVPPATSQRITGVAQDQRKEVTVAEQVDLTAWLRREEALNGLLSTQLDPWHIVVAYDQFDEDGDNVNSGVYEEFWAGPKKYKRIYKSDTLNQTDYATDKGLFRSGDQRWANQAELQVREEIIEPFYYGATLQDVRARNVERTFSGYNLQCVLLEKAPQILSDPPQYCFETNGSILRYSRGLGWNQTVYNQIVSFQGRNIAQEVDVTAGGKPYLKLRVHTIELISHIDEANFSPSKEAIGPFGERISGVRPYTTKFVFPVWPVSVRGQHFSVEVEVVIGKDGRVISAHAVSGPKEGQKPCEQAVRQWMFRPYAVLEKPVEVETKVECRK